MRRFFNWRAGCMAAWSVALCARSQAERPPNVIIILADDQGYNDASINTHLTGVYTPRLEQLAESGIVFSDAYASATMCVPSRVGMLTGRAPARFGVYDVGGDAAFTWPREQMILSQYLKRAGYQTGIIGKWHCGGEIERWYYNHPLERGFDRFWGFMGSTKDFWDPLIGAGVNAAGYWSCGYNPIFDQREIVSEISYLTDDITEQSVRFIRENKDRPFFLFVSHHAPHVPLQVPRETYDEYVPLGYGKNTTITRAMYEHMDRGVGEILDELDRHGLRRNTLIIYSSDNGGSERSGQLNSRFRGGKFTLMEGGIRVPLVISWPEAFPQGVLFCDPVWNLDFVPTILAALRLEPDGDVDGVNLIPYLTGERASPPHEALFWKQPENMRAYAVRSGDWKLVYGRLGRGLYNLADDPGETTDRRDEFPELTRRLQGLWDRWDQQNISSIWNEEYHRKYYARRVSDNPLENKSYRYGDTFGGTR